VAVFSPQKAGGFAFGGGIFYIAPRLSLSIAQIPANWVAQPGSKGNLVTPSIPLLGDICRGRPLHRKLRHAPPLLPLRRRQGAATLMAGATRGATTRTPCPARGRG